MTSIEQTLLQCLATHGPIRGTAQVGYALWPDRSMQPQGARWPQGRSCAAFAIKGTWPATTKVSCRGMK